jgi:BirA family biotin operon repressor/biotin-[acetyl-CoA-carboxylase] ligase
VDELDETRLRGLLATGWLGRWLRVVGEVGSTMDLLAELARRGVAPDGAVVLAEHQTAGRGRQGRTWVAPGGQALLLSMLFRGAGAAGRLERLPMAVGLGVLDGLAAAGLPSAGLGLKWPNDIVWQERKLAGLLAERDDGDSAGPALRVGLGLNVGQRTGDLPPGAISLAAGAGAPPGRNELAAALLRGIEGRIDAVRSGEDPVTAWSERLLTLGRIVTVLGPGGPVTGEAVGVTGDGWLRLRDAAGLEHIFGAGDVTIGSAPAALE